uniref:polycomb group protein Psc-like n=1 Tax=Styela clava TaxID=7725 RepID=UPI00193AD0A8|nr:polycomb group protein Psc-like [Styela clava]
MYGKLSLKLRDLNDHLVCALCGGYFIDATTIIECLHSFCRSCIVTYLASNKCCPKCEIPAHKTRPLLNIRSDKTLQDVVYKLVPNLFDKEIKRKESFHEETGIPMNVEERKRVLVTNTPEKKEHRVSLSIEYDSRHVTLTDNSLWIKEESSFPKRYLRCFDTVTIGTINKLIRNKLSRDDLEVITFCRGELLPEKYTLMDVTKTFAWKSDRPLSLTYMTFKSKNRKRKILEDILNAKQESSVPAKKLFKESPISKMSSNVSANHHLNDNKANELKALSSTTNELAFSSHSSGTNTKSPLSKSKMTTVGSSKSHGNSQNGGKNKSYSVMNVPLLEAVKAPVAEASQKTNLLQQRGNRNLSQMSAQRQDGLKEATQHAHSLSGVERVKSINSIANRLQIKQQMQNEKSRSETEVKSFVSREDSNRSKQFSSAQFSPPPPVSLTPTQTVAAMKIQHDQLTRRLNLSKIQNLSTDEAHSLALECVRNTMMTGSRPVAPSQALPRQTTVQAPALNTPATKFIQLKRTDLPNYAQATELMRRAQMIKQARLKYQGILPKPTTQRPESRPVQPTQRIQRSLNAEDLQLLSTTRELASLRQQQKLLNEFAAAAMHGRSKPPLRTSETIRAASSSMSPRMTSPTHVSISHQNISNKAHSSQRQLMPFSNMQPRFSVVSPKKISQSAQDHMRKNGASIHAVRENGVKSTDFSTVPSNASPSLLNNSRDTNIDIYKHTIAKARDTIRQMDSLKNRMTAPGVRGRTLISPHQSPRFQKRSPTTRTTFAPRVTQPVLIAPKPIPTLPRLPSPKVAQLNIQNNARPSTRPQKIFSPIMTSPYAPNRHTFPPPLRTIKPTETPVTATNQPEQEQPLCLVMKK